MSSEVTISAAEFAAFKADVDERFENFVSQLALLNVSIATLQSSTGSTSSSSIDLAVLKADIDERFENFVSQLTLLNNDVVAIQNTTVVTDFPDEEQQIREKWLSAFSDEVASLLANVNKINTDIITLQRLVGAVEVDHGNLTGLSDDDHAQYLLTDGSRTLNGSLTVTGSGMLTGDVRTAGSYYGDGSHLSGIGASADHGTLAGLGDDDHTQYTLANGTRAFTGTVGGVTPVANADLTTKLYTDTLVAASGAIVEASAKTYTDEQIAANPGVTDHGALTGLTDDDHPQYLLADGSRHVTGELIVEGSGYFTGDLYTDGTVHGAKRSVRFVIDNGNTEIGTGVQDAEIRLNFPLRINRWSVLATPSGNIELDVLTGSPTLLPLTQSITGSEQPSLTNSRYATATTLVGWTNTIPSDNALDVEVVSCSGVTKCYLDLYGIEV